MTRLAVLADIHGNLPALEAVLADMAGRGVDQAVIAGDVIHRGPFNAATAALVIDRRWPVIRGNNEYFLLDYNTPRAPEKWAREPLLPWLYESLRGPLHRQIACWPDTLSLRFPDGPPIRVIHGTPQSVNGFIHAISPDDETLFTLLAGVEEDTVIGGHVHLSFDRRAGRWRFLNPGSVGMPFDGITDASYLILESRTGDWMPEFYRVPYDLGRVFEEYERQQFVQRFGVLARLIVEEVRIARPLAGAFRMWHKDQCPGEPQTVALVEYFLKHVDWWPYHLEEYRVNMQV